MTSSLPVPKRRPPPSLTLVVPCYNEEEVLPELLRRLAELTASLVAEGLVRGAPEVMLVDDGSRDDTWSLIAAAAERGEGVTGVRLSRNHGHQRALLAGLMTAKADVLISLDADLQDDIAVIPAMIRAWMEGAEIVYGVRGSRDVDTMFKRATARMYYKLLRSMGADVVSDHADFRLMGRKAVEALRQYSESNLFLRGLIPQLGYRTATVTYARGERFAGVTKYPFGRMIALAVEGITSFSTVPLRVVTWAGVIIAAVSFAYVCYAVFARLIGIAIPGWASIVVPIYLLGGIQLIAIGIIGEYLGKVYLESKRRPRFLIDEIVGGVDQ